jgi:tRNA nucleotidyltransferase/poly(A) polymerase|tara:strand:+ start:524 stop:1249 length:726 start_codon:yes stop_codon:yes gene_type:complete
MKYKLFEVGGKIRDEILGLESKDIDYSVVLDTKLPIEKAFHAFSSQLKLEGYEVFVETPECQTIRAMFPKDHKYKGVADFVIARKEVGYIKGTRTPIVELGTLQDDLARRDFTVNAIAKDSEGNLIDPFNGQKDLAQGLLRTPLNTAVSFNDDPLRILRAIRFNITKGLELSDDIWRTLATYDYTKMHVVSGERQREELYKMFKHDTLSTLSFLQTLSKVNYMLYFSIFPKDLWLEPTFKK